MGTSMDCTIDLEEHEISTARLPGITKTIVFEVSDRLEIPIEDILDDIADWTMMDSERLDDKSKLWDIVFDENVVIGLFAHDRHGNFDYMLFDDSREAYVLRFIDDIIRNSTLCDRTVKSIEKCDGTPQYKLGYLLNHLRLVRSFGAMTCEMDELAYEICEDTTHMDDAVDDAEIERLNELNAIRFNKAYRKQAKRHWLKFPAGAIKNNVLELYDSTLHGAGIPLHQLFGLSETYTHELTEQLHFWGDGFIGDEFYYDASTDTYINSISVDPGIQVDRGEFGCLGLLMNMVEDAIDHGKEPLLPPDLVSTIHVLFLNSRKIGYIVKVDDEHDQSYHLSLQILRECDRKFISSHMRCILADMDKCDDDYPFKSLMINDIQTQLMNMLHALVVDSSEEGGSLTFKSESKLDGAAAERLDDVEEYTRRVVNEYSKRYANSEDIEEHPSIENKLSMSPDVALLIDYGLINDHKCSRVADAIRDVPISFMHSLDYSKQH